MSGWRPALRIARREARRARGRSALVLAMIALPVTFLSFVAVGYDMFTLSKPEEVTRSLGGADAMVSWVNEGPISQSPAGFVWSAGLRRDPPAASTELLLSHLPPGSRAVPDAEGVANVHTPAGLATISARRTDLADPMLRGKALLLEGRAPAGTDQVALSRRAARRLDVGVGRSVKLVDPPGVFTVSGLVEYPADLSEIIVFGPEVAGAFPSHTWLVTTPVGLDWDAVTRLNAFGMHVYSREVNLDPVLGNDFGSELPPTQELALGVIITGLAMLEIVLLAGPAFAVGARRRARELALIAAAGGQPRQLRRMVLAEGVVLGLGGAIGGLVAGVGLACAARSLLEEFVIQARAGGWRFFPLALLGIVGLAVGTGLLAAMVPAWTAARQDVVRALNGRPGVTHPRRRWVVAGLVLVALGIAIAALAATDSNANLILLGLILLELGLVLVTPALIGMVARAGRWLPLAPRLALRGAARNRSSAAPAISAVMAAVAGAVAVGVFAAGSDRQSLDRYEPSLPPGYLGVHAYFRADFGSAQAEPDWSRALEIVREVLPDARPVLLREPDRQAFIPFPSGAPGGGSWQWSIVDDGTALEALTAADPADLARARRMLEAGGVVVTDPAVVVDGHVTVAVEEFRLVSLPAYALTSGVPSVGIVLSPGALAQSGLGARTSGVVAQTAAPPTPAEEERLNLLLAELAPTLRAQVERGPQQPTGAFELVLGLAAAAIALGAAGIATGLAAADSRADLATLAAVGARPGLRRGLSLSHAGLISGLGAALGTLTGLGTAAALIVASNQLAPSFDLPVPFVVPWTSVAIVVVAPLLAMAGAGLLTGSGLPIERRM